jgi:hypothetical protein
VDWIHLSHNKIKWWALVNMVMTFRFHKTWISRLAEQLLASQEELC